MTKKTWQCECGLSHDVKYPTCGAWWRAVCDSARPLYKLVKCQSCGVKVQVQRHGVNARGNKCPCGGFIN